MLGRLFKKDYGTPLLGALENDLHCHLLPGVDDGCKTIEETIICLETMRRLGLKKVTLTPHFCFPRYPNEEDDIKRRYEALKKQLERERPELSAMIVGLGGEYRIDDGLEKRVKEGRELLYTAGERLLLELSLHQPRMGLEETMFDLQMRGHELILAHPERYPYFNVGSELLARLKEQGVMFQVNLLSLSGFYGEGAQKRAVAYIEKGWVDYLGTDMHNQLYAKASEDASEMRKVRKVIEKAQFKNSEL